MTLHNKEWKFRRMVVDAATRKRRPDDVGLRRPAHKETPLSNAEIFYGVQHGLISLPPLNQGA